MKLHQDTLLLVAMLAVQILVVAIVAYFSAKNTKGPRERAFKVRAIILLGICLCVFAIGDWFLPAPYRQGLAVLYILGAWPAIRHWNKRQAAIRAEESNDAA